MIDKKYYIKNIALKNFKCFDNQKYYIFEFGKNASPIILSGPNGFGKTTFFDAIELMLSNNITRFNKDIEYSNTNLEANILVNSEDQPAYIILTLVNDKMEELQILGRVDNEYKNIDISKSLTYYQVDNIINFNKCNLDIDEEIFIEKYCKKINIEYIEKMLKYKMDKFNIKYYLSQEDSIHYLKENIKQRNANLGSFLNIYEEKDILSFIEKINTKTSAIGNGIIGRAEKNCKDNLDLKIEKLKELKSYSKKSEDIKYKDIFPKKLKGETENFSFNEEFDIGDNIDMKLSETWEEELLKLKTLIGNWDYYKNKFVKKDKYKKIKKAFTKENLEYYTLDIFNNCGYISDLTNNEDYKILEEKYLLVKNTEAIVSLIKNKEVNKAILINEFKFLNEIHNFDFNIDSIESELDEIIEKESLLGSESKLIKDIREKRINLKNSFEKYGNDNNTCPYCATEFESMEELLEKFNDYESELAKLAGISSQKFETKKDELIKQIKEKFEDEFLETIDSSHQNKSKIYVEYEKIENIINNAKLKEDLDFINDNINKLEELKIDNFDEMDKEDKISLIEKKIEEINGNLESLNNELESYKLIYSKYWEIIELNIETLSQKEIDNKIIYIENMKMLENNKKITELEKEIDNLILEYLQYEKIRMLLGELRKIYHNRIEEIKKETTSDIRVPLLIYTAKILQDYQDGLGVFIDDRDYRFKSSGYKKADILNTFSSGQLSGFSLAFLLTMNRVYSNSSNLNILLIDDPVQTLDDINLSSFVEVLRNEFKNKQIILSTHELEKEYYMLYKFFRNGLKGESYNVKNRLY